MKKVLIISYYCPPRKGIASMRIKGLLKYLPEYGWEPTVLTAKLTCTPKEYNIIETEYPGDISEIIKKKIGFNKDKGFQEQLGIPIQIREGKQSFTGKIINKIKELTCFPDEQKLWFKYAVAAGENLLKNNNFDIIFSSSGPYTSHLIAKFMKERYKIPWVADLRDLWTQNHYYQYGKVRQYFEKRLEKNTLKYSDCLVTVSKPLARKLKELHVKKKIYVITNGYDEDEIFFKEKSKDFLIIYTGRLYLGKRDPSMLFKIIRELIDENKVNEEKIKIVFYGEKQFWLDKEIKQFKLENIIFQEGYVNREVILEKQRESQLLLLLNWDDPRERGIYTGKVFEYLAAQRPIIAFGGRNNTVISKLLMETKAGFHLYNEKIAKNILLNLYMEYCEKGEVEYRGIYSKISKYSHREMAKKFSKIFNKLIS